MTDSWWIWCNASFCVIELSCGCPWRSL